MSEQNTSVASGSKVKDPRRVAAGKRLAAISRKAKEEKALRLSQQSENAELNDKTIYIVGGLLAVGAISYYLLFLNKKQVVQTSDEDEKEPKQEPAPKKSGIFDD